MLSIKKLKAEQIFIVYRSFLWFTISLPKTKSFIEEHLWLRLCSLPLFIHANIRFSFPSCINSQPSGDAFYSFKFILLHKKKRINAFASLTSLLWHSFSFTPIQLDSDRDTGRVYMYRSPAGWIQKSILSIPKNPVSFCCRANKSDRERKMLVWCRMGELEKLHNNNIDDVWWCLAFVWILRVYEIVCKLNFKLKFNFTFNKLWNF